MNNNIKYKLANAMKECMFSSPVEKITVKEICDTCGVTRQTFYRNFQDKYDLINWYFDKILIESFEHMGEGQTVYESRAVQGRAFRRFPAKAGGNLLAGGLPARRRRAGPLPRLRHYGGGCKAARTALHRHRAEPGLLQAGTETDRRR